MGRERGRGAAAAQAACTGGRPDSRLRVRARAERTLNMLFTAVTLDVSKVSGWLNADAPCRVERRACDVGRNAGRQTGGDGQGTRGAHVEHVIHDCDLRRVEAQRLVER